MQTIDIENFHARYRLPKSAPAASRRLDRLLDDCLDELLERALDRVGFAPNEQICLRHVFVPVRVRMSGSDQSILEAWSLALAECIRNAIDHGRARATNGDLFAVVRYSSRAQAMIDLATSVIRGDTSRAWAWRQLGLWRPGSRMSSIEATRELVRALAREATMIVPVLAALAERGLLEHLGQLLGADEWIALAAEALKAAGATLDWRDLGPTPGPQTPEFAPPAPPAPPAPTAPSARETLRLARRLVRSSRLAPALMRTVNMPAAQRALAALILLESSPILALQHRRQVMNILEAMRTANELPETTPETPKPRVENNQPAELRHSAFTQYGGLLFFLTLLNHLDFPRRIPEMFPERPFRWVLHQLALTLVPAAPGDAAALAFAGLSPMSQPPDGDEQPAVPALTEVGSESSLPRSSPLAGTNCPSNRRGDLIKISAIVEELRAELIRRLQPLELPPEALVEFICVRRAEIIADPGWIEARFSLDTVSTGIRRAALDLDPGFVPWLGVVIHFVYE